MNANPNPDCPGTTGRHPVWTEEDIRALGLITDVPTAARIFGIGHGLAYQLAREDRFPAPVIKIRARYLVPVAGVLRCLRLAGADEAPDGEREPTGLAGAGNHG